MFRDNEPTSQQDLVHMRYQPLGSGTWVVGLTLTADHPARKRQLPSRFHFVLDNSGSMGSNSMRAKECFASLIELANGPCSLTVFAQLASVIGDSFTKASCMQAAKLPPQGNTNITAGVEAALQIIKSCEDEEASEAEHTHHVLILLSDGAHNSGPRPEDRLVHLGLEFRALFPKLRLSVVVVGVTRSSNTSMGMLLKQSLETVPLPSLQPIYFASTPSEMGEALQQMKSALSELTGGLVNVSAIGSCRILRMLGEEPITSSDFPVESAERIFICVGDAPPTRLNVDGDAVEGYCITDFDSDLVSSALQDALDALRVKRVASGSEAVRPALAQLNLWISDLEEEMCKQAAKEQPSELNLRRATPAQRLSQYKALTRTMQGAKELRNQLADIEALNTNDSASQAAFLTGAKQKYGAKALRRANGEGLTDSSQKVAELVSDLQRLGPKVHEALRKDFCNKLSALSSEGKACFCERLKSQNKLDEASIQALCEGKVTPDTFSGNHELAKIVDSDLVTEALAAAAGSARSSYLSMQSVWEHLREWSSFATEASKTCKTEYEFMMFLGTLGYPIDVKRRAATQMDPFAMNITRIRASLVDTASLATALQSGQTVYPPEGGSDIQDVLVLVDPDAPLASRLVVESVLLNQVYTSVVLCRDLHMYTGNKMRLALHAHALLSAVLPPTRPSDEDLIAQLRRQYLGRAYQCAECGFGPVDHFACGDLFAHHGEDHGAAQINNACPRCQWFSADIADWPHWDGSVPPEAVSAQAHDKAPLVSGPTAAALDIALRICYSARVIWQQAPNSEVKSLCKRLADWETLTTADGIDHPVQLLLALAVTDDFSEDFFSPVAVRILLSEVCARTARNELRMANGTDELAVLAAARKRVCTFLSVTSDSAPTTLPLEHSEPQQSAVEEACSAEYTLDDRTFDFKAWVHKALDSWLPALAFVKQLQQLLTQRAGGWPQLMRDMEAGPGRYEDVIKALQSALQKEDQSLMNWLGASDSDSDRVLATVAAQAFLHQSSHLRRTTVVGGSLQEPLGDVCDSNTLRKVCVSLRMVIYEERVAAKMREWARLGSDITYQRARVADLAQYAHMCSEKSHVHGLDKATFWGLWKAASSTEKVLAFLGTANKDFAEKHVGR